MKEKIKINEFILRAVYPEEDVINPIWLLFLEELDL